MLAFMSLSFIIGLLFIPLVGVYIGIKKVIFDDNNEWQKQNKGAHIIRGGK
jgi:cadmium resistance protein CadD (predicted permease)